MPNTEPPIDSAGVAREVLALGRRLRGRGGRVGGHHRRAGRASAWRPWASWPSSGCTIFTDDGAGVQDGALMRRALDYAKGLGVTLAQHCEDELPGRRWRHARGCWSSRLGLPGIRRRPRRRWWRATSRWSG